ncbi:hypothetical protein H0H87_005052 [Tephrocybe sp. NHM501043]|nr:hypothetical protein H0H87_005052 [Tephrocybe sp. NHM501043]
MILSRALYRGLRPLAVGCPRALFHASRILAHHHEPNTPPTAQSVSPHAPIGVSAALDASIRVSDAAVRPKIFDEFSLERRVGVVTGGHRGLGLEMALALCELGARVYCLDLPRTPSEEWQAAREYVRRIGTGGRLEYVCADVRDQRGVWARVANIGDLEERMDICVAAAGINREDAHCLEQSAEAFRAVLDVNVNGVLYAAQAAGRQMLRFGNAGSIILVASISGRITNKNNPIIPYNTSKSAVLQMARSMACELGPKHIRVNTISPGHMSTPLTAARLAQPGVLETWSGMYPMGRIGRPDELRGAVAWLASDASSFCTGSDIVVDGGYTAW